MLSIPAWAVMPRVPQAQSKFGSVPASAFAQLGSHCSWGHAARRPRLQPALEALLPPLHSVTPLLLKPLESMCCSEPWWFQDAGYLPHPEPHRVWGSSVWSDTARPVLCKQVLGIVWQVASLFCPGYLSVRITAWLPRCCEGC